MKCGLNMNTVLNKNKPHAALGVKATRHSGTKKEAKASFNIMWQKKMGRVHMHFF